MKIKGLRKKYISVSWAKHSQEDFDFGMFKSKNKIKVSENIWNEYLDAREKFEIMHQNLIDGIPYAKRCVCVPHKDCGVKREPTKAIGKPIEVEFYNKETWKPIKFKMSK